MNVFLKSALACAEKGWYVFPCRTRTKQPAIAGGFKAATNDEAPIRAWWERWPDANIGIACGASRIAVLDCDHGNATEAQALAWMVRAGVPETYTVHTGRRWDKNDPEKKPEYGVQLYFQGTMPDVGEFRLAGGSGQIKSLGGYILGPGSVHDVSGEMYEVLIDRPLTPLPDSLRALRSERKNVEEDDQPITENRNNRLTSIAGKLRNAGLSAAELGTMLLSINERRCQPPLSEREVQRIAYNASRWELPTADPVVVIGGKSLAVESTEPGNWRKRYLTFEKVRDAKPTEFLIDGFLALGSITALAAPVAQRKSLIAMNIAHALCSGESLFGHFAVKNRPERVVYLCPEMGIASFSTRLKKIGLDAYVGDTLFVQTMDEERLSLKELDQELPGAVVIIDTLTRFVEGDQNSSDAMSKFADVVFGLKRRGATVVVLHHSVKGAASSLTLDSAMRGSTELAAFVTCCWATRLKDPDDPYRSASLLVNVKQRDFESKPFEVTADETCRMTILGVPGQVGENKARADAEAEAALAAILNDSPKTMGINKLQKALGVAGHKRGGDWVTKARARLRGTGVTLTE